MDYNKTINLPKTEFPMRAGLPKREPEMLKRWQEQDIYNELLKKNEGKPRFSLHDGPPFSNGNLHMGHALNKALKDFIVRSQAMMGHYTPYVPGWDNHGLPIERAIETSKKKLNKDMTVPEFRTACEAFAEDFIQKQMGGFKRLGVVGDWKKPYRTMDKHFEAQEVKVFGRMFDKGFIYKGLKPVTWCPFCATAVAEADIEYKDDPCTSVYVKFPMKDDQGKLEGYDKSKLFFVIWTTTIWTLPGNLAICLHPRDAYALVKASDGNTYIMAEALVEKTMKMGGFEEYEIVATYPGQFFENMLAQHPFLDKTSRLVNAEYVTMDSGTGCVHTAPGFGADDYQTCMRYGMELVVPVDDYGRHTDYAGKYAGLKTEESNPVILADMRENGSQNYGATNTLLLVGKKWAAVVMAFDILKSFLAVKIAQLLVPLSAWITMAAGFFAVIGHCFPFYMKFKGGKGLAAYGGIVLAYNPILFILMLATATVLIIIVNYSFIMPVKTVGELQRMLLDSEEEDARIFVSRKNILMKLGDLTFFSRLIDGEYIDYDRVIVQNHRILVETDRAVMISALERAAEAALAIMDKGVPEAANRYSGSK